MKLVILFGAGAVGKMTVGQALAACTKLRLYHGHMDIEMVLEIFGFLKSGVSSRIRHVIFDEFAGSDLYGMIFTYMWAFDYPEDWENVDGLVDIFRRRGADIYYVELVADQEVRLARNATENRLRHKASKRDLDVSNARLLGEDANYRLQSHDGEIPFENYMKIDNTHLQPEEVAGLIQERFGL